MNRTLVEWRDDVVIVTLNRPEVLNALDFEMLDELASALQTEGGRARAVILKGSGDRSFSAGFDLGRLDGTDADVRADDSIGAAATAIRECPAPVIACIRGHCHGAGVELALSCDLRVAADDLQLSVRAVGLGVVYRVELLTLLVEQCGLGRARDLMLAMPVLDAKRALAWGLLTEVVPAPELESRVIDLAQALAHAPRSSVIGTKATLRMLAEATLHGVDRTAVDAWRVRSSATSERKAALSEAQRQLGNKA